MAVAQETASRLDPWVSDPSDLTFLTPVILQSQANLSGNTGDDATALNVVMLGYLMQCWQALINPPLGLTKNGFVNKRGFGLYTLQNLAPLGSASIEFNIATTPVDVSFGPPNIYKLARYAWGFQDSINHKVFFNDMHFCNFLQMTLVPPRGQWNLFAVFPFEPTIIYDVQLADFGVSPLTWNSGGPDYVFDPARGHVGGL